VHAHGASRNILVALVLNISFTVIEFVGGLLTGSVAILADAIHDLGDSVSLAVAYGLERYARRRPDQNYSYGYGRYSLLSALVSGVVLVVGGLLVIREALPRFWEPQTPHAGGMIGLAVLGIAVNGYAAWKLARGRTANERVLTWHLAEDALGWGATLVGGLVIHLSGWTLVDPILALALAAFVLWNAVRNLRQVLRLLLQGMPPSFDQVTFRTEILALEGVTDLHDLHGWSLDGDSSVISMHLVLREANLDVARLKQLVHQIAARYGSRHVTIETEILGETCVAKCDDK